MRPKTSLLLSLALAAAATTAGAQSLMLRASLDFESYVLNESVPLTVSVENRGASPFICDDYGDYRDNSFTIVLRHESDGYQEASRQGMPFGAVMIPAGQTQAVTCMLNDWFPLLRQGKYMVQVFVRRGPETVSSSMISFSIVRGLEIETKTHMIPDSDTRARRYTLLYWPRKQREDLFLRVEEEPGDKVVALFCFGAVVRYVQPSISFGSGGEVRVLHQIGRDRFVRTILQSDAKTLEVVEQQRLVDPSQATAAQSVIRSREEDLAGGVPLESFRRRRRTAESGDEGK